MSNQTFNQFASSQNLKRAFAYVKLETEQSTLPLDPFWTPGIKAVDRLGDAFFNSLSKLLLENKYTPENIYFFHQHKEDYSIRKLAMITIVDRIVYQAILNPNILGLQLSNISSSFSCYPGVIKNENHYLGHYKKPYEKYWNFQESFYKNSNMNFRGEYDIHCFFDNVSHEILFKQIEKNKIGSKKVKLLLKKILSKWFAGGKGVPQGPQASSVLANYYLSDLDDMQHSMPIEKVGYVRYMDDISIMAKTEKLLLEWIEKLTYKLDEIGLVLNSKFKKEKIHNVDYFKDKGIAPYQAIYEFSDQFFIEGILNSCPSIIGNLTRGKDMSKADFSKFKYFLKASQDYSLAKEVILIYPNLPSFAGIIAKYLQPISNEAWVQTLILQLLNEHHLFRWQKLWLVKLLLIEKVKGSSEYSQIDFRKDNNWELRSMAWLAEIISGGNIPTQKISRLVKQSENNFELAIYLSLIPMLKDGKSKTILEEYVNSSSLEIQTIVKSIVFDDQQLASCIKHADLFVDSKVASQKKGGTLTQTLEDSLELTLGFHNTTHIRNRYIFELKTNGHGVVMMGSLLSGKSIPVLRTGKAKSSRMGTILKTLLDLHKTYDPTSLQLYSQENLENIYKGKKEDLLKFSMTKDKRSLHNFCQKMIGYMLDQGRNKDKLQISFKSALDVNDFENLSDEDRHEIKLITSKLLNTVNP